MNVNPLGILGVVLAFVCFVVSFWKLRNKQKSERIKWLILFAVLGTPTILFAAYYLHVLPESEAFYEFRSWPGTELFAVFVGGLAGVIATFLPRWFIVAPFLGMAAIVVGPFIKPVIGPLPDSTFQNAWKGSVCLQSTPSTCGPASVATIMRYFNVPTSEMEVAKGAYSYRRGTEAWYLARYVRGKGLHAKFIFADGFSPDISMPAVAGVHLGSIGHFIALLEREGDNYVVGDPLNGQESLTKEDLLKRYGFTGFFMNISKD